MTTDAMEAAARAMFEAMPKAWLAGWLDWDETPPWDRVDFARCVEAAVQAHLTARLPDLEAIRERGSGVVLATNLKGTDAWQLINDDIPTLLDMIASLREREKKAGEAINELIEFIRKVPHHECLPFKEWHCGQHGLLDKYAPDWRDTTARATLTKEKTDG